MIPITPEMTAEQLRSLSENIKSTIVSLTSDLEAITNAINAKNEAHAVAVETSKIDTRQNSLNSTRTTMI